MRANYCSYFNISNPKKVSAFGQYHLNVFRDRIGKNHLVQSYFEMIRKFCIKTLGCRLNRAESQQLKRSLVSCGWQSGELAEADLVVINSCVVTQKAEKETRQLVEKVKRINTKARIVLAGCWVDKANKFGGIGVDGVSELIGNRGKWAELLPKSTNSSPDKVDVGFRGLIKVQDGCDNQCCYCLPRLLRGPSISIPAAQVVAQVNQVLRSGVLEVALTGQNLSAYQDGQLDWVGLVKKVLQETDVKLLRLGSVNPRIKSLNELIDLFNGVGRNRLSRHLHLSLQSGSDRVLKLMKREYTVGEFFEVARQLRRSVDGINITTDVIVGFPGETETDFEKTLSFCQKVAFGKIHVFRYSSRAGTLAAEMPNQVEEEIKKRRASELLKVEKQLRLKFWQSQVGKEAMAVVWKKGRGLSDNYIPVKTHGSERRGIFRIRFSEFDILKQGRIAQLVRALIL